MESDQDRGALWTRDIVRCSRTVSTATIYHSLCQLSFANGLMATNRVLPQQNASHDIRDKHSPRSCGDDKRHNGAADHNVYGKPWDYNHNDHKGPHGHSHRLRRRRTAMDGCLQQDWPLYFANIAIVTQSSG